MTAAGDTWPEDIEVRPIGADEIDAFLDVFETAWGFAPDGEQRRRTGAVVAGESPLGAFADGDMAGTVMSFALELTVPGHAQMPMAGVSYVAVHPLRRRRGIMRALMHYQLDDLHARGVPVAGLGASEAGIYGRFGYGPATWDSSWRLARGAARYLAESGDACLLELVDERTARDVFPAVHDRARRSQVGDVRTYPAGGMTSSSVASSSFCAGIRTGARAGTRSTGSSGRTGTPPMASRSWTTSSPAPMMRTVACARTWLTWT
jgi:predicted N-acetyltransferase YhbS